MTTAARTSRGRIGASFLAALLGVVLVIAFFANQRLHCAPTKLEAVRGRVTEVASHKGGLSIFLIPEGASYEAGRYYRYASTSGDTGLVRAMLLEQRSSLVTLRYAPSSLTSGEGTCAGVYEVLVDGHPVRTISQVLASQRANDILLLSLGVLLIAGTVAWYWFVRRGGRHAPPR